MNIHPWPRLARATLALAGAVALTLSAPLTAYAATPTYYLSDSITGIGKVPTGVAVNKTTNRVYVASGYAKTVAVIDAATNAVIDTIGVGRSPSAVAVNETTNTIYVTNWNDDTMSVIDGATGAVTATIATGSLPGSVAVNQTTNTVYVSNQNEGTVSVIDGATNTVTGTINVADARKVAVDTGTGSIYVTRYYGASVVVIDGVTNTVTDSISVDSYPSGVAVDATVHRAYVTSVGEHTLTVIDTRSNAIITVIPSMGIASDLSAVDESTHTVFVNSSEGGGMTSVIDGVSNVVAQTVAAGSQPMGVAVNPTTHKAYVASQNDASLKVLSTVVAPTITTSSLPAGTVDTAYSQTVEASGTTPVSFAVSAGSLPSGLTLDSDTGVVSGTPTAVGSQTFTITATNVGGTDSKEYTLAVAAAAVAPSITLSSLPAGTVGSAYSQTVTATGTTPILFEVSYGSLPAGLTLDSATGVISGTPTAVGSATFTITATNAGGIDSKAFSVAVAAGAVAPSVTTDALAAGTVGAEYSQTVTATGTAPFTFEVSAGSLPDGLELDSATGVISGTPTTAGSVTFTISVTNSGGVDSQEYTIAIAGSSDLATTGFDVLPWGIGGVLALLVGAALILVAKYRRNQSA